MDPRKLEEALYLQKRLNAEKERGTTLSDAQEAALERANKLLLDNLGTEQATVEMIEKHAAAQEKVAESARKARLSRQQQLKLLAQERVELEKNQVTTAQRAELEENRLDTLRLQLEEARSKDELDQVGVQRLKEDIKKQEKKLNLLKKQEGSILEFLKTLYKTEGAGKKVEFVVDQIGEKVTSSLAGGFNRLAGMISGPIISGIKDLVFQFDNVTKGFARATGTNQEFNDSMMQSFERGKAYGVSMQDASDAHMALISSVNEFTMASEAERQAIGDTISMLNEFGMASADTARGVQNSMAYFNQSIGEAEQTLIELKGLANDLQVMPAEMAAAYAKMGPELAKFGNQGVATFKELARVQKLTGFEMEKVLRLTAKFDTFEGAATAAGNLNAALGTNAVNAMDLLMETDPAARFGMIRDSILDAGLSFDSMSYFQKQFFAEAAGLDSVGDLALMLRGRMDLMSGATDESAQSYEEMALQAQQLQTFQEQMQAILAENAPLFKDIALAATGFLRVMQEQENLLPKMFGLYASLKVAGFALSGAQLALANSSKGAAKGFGLLAIVAAAIAYLFFQQTFMSNYVEATYKMSFAFLALAVSLRIARPAFTGVGAAAGSAGTGMFVLAGAIALIGAGIAVAAGGMSLLVDAFVRLFTAVPVEEFLLFAYGTVTLGAGAVLAGVGLAIMGAGMLVLGVGLLLVSTSKLQAVGDILMGMGKIGETGVNFSNVAGGIEAVADAADSIDTGSLKILSTMVDMAPGFNTLASSINTVSSSFSGLVSAMASISGGQAEGVATSMERVSEALNEVPTVKTVLITAGFGAMGLAATSMVPLALALAAGSVVSNTIDRATGNRTDTSNSSSDEPKEIMIQLDADETRRFFEGEIVRTQGRQNREGLFQRG
jgi:hypothetical protein